MGSGRRGPDQGIPIRTPLPTASQRLASLGVSLRASQPDDASFLRDVYVAYRWEETEASGWPQAARLAFLHDQHRMQDLHYRKHYDGAAFAVIEAGGERAGRLYLQRSSSDLRIVDIALMPAFRNRGFGGALLEAVQDLGRTLGVATVSIHVEQSNPAQHLYERLGFRKIEVRGIYHLLEWTPAQEPQVKTAS